MMYKTKGVCAQAIEFEVDDNKKVHNVKFIGGCSGNTQGVAALVKEWTQMRLSAVWKEFSVAANLLPVQTSL